MENTINTVPGTDASLDNLSQDDIEKLLTNAADVPESANDQGEIEVDINDVDSLESLGIFDKDAAIENPEGSPELDEISSLLEKADNNEYSLSEEDELMNLITLENERNSKEEEIRNRKNLDDNTDEESSEGKKEKKKFSLFKKKDKNKKDALDEVVDEPEGEEKPVKEPGLIAKFIAFLTAAEEDEEEEKQKQAASEGGEPVEAEGGEFGFEEVKGENKEILDEIDKEDEGKGKKKKKKDKKKKDKKGKGGDADASDDGEEGEGDGKKKKKAKKEKKEKKPKVEEPDNSKPLNKKNVRKIFVLAATLLLLILLAVKFLPSMISHRQARAAYYKGDYETTYTEFFGEKLSEGDRLLFERSQILLKVDHKYEAFTIYNKMNMRPQALDQLIQAVHLYEPWLLVAETYGCEEDFKASYSKIVTALDVSFGITEERAREIYALPTDLEYSLMVESIANGTEYIDPNVPLPEPFVPDEGTAPDAEHEYEDMLPEEQL